MQNQRVCAGLRVFVSFFSALWPVFAWSQAAAPQSRIAQPVDESVLVTLRGNTHPLAQGQFDRGAAPPDLPMARMLLVLKRSDAQEAALEKLLDDQQDQSSPNYHQWLTPDQFGQQFGPSDQDIQAVTAWLRSHGFQIGQVGRGRTVIEFSGTAAQVQQAFRTEIHKFTANGKDHWANASNPQIPEALSPVVEGIASLHNFPKQPQHRIAGKFSKDKVTGQVQTLSSDFTTVDGPICHLSGLSGYCYFVGPYDFAKIYNVLPLWNEGIDGTGQSIAIVSESNINLQDVRDFRALFGLPAKDPQIFLNGPDPGLVPGPETEALLDVEWAGGVAKGATIKLVVSPPTNSTEGADLAGLYAVENNLAPVISESWGDCELFLGAAGNSFESAIRQQAAAQGITYINSSGDEGSARCDPVLGPPPAPATHGLIVSGLASTPYGVAVGGTDFQNFRSDYSGFHSPSPYWSTSNGANELSAGGYIPETTWNENCTNPVFVFLGAGSTPEAACNNSQRSSWVETIASGGGKSNCTISDQTNPNFCMGGYPKPSWQTALSPADGARDIPDVALFASAGFMDSSYIVCESDELPTPQSCSLTTPRTTFLGVGGTSASAPAFAGIMALANQYTHSSGQGNANYVLYRLAASSLQTSNSCGATSNPSSKCIFYDVTTGANTVPCWNGTFDCTSMPGDTYGVLPGYNAGPGYDLATGLGSVNAYNLIHSWTMPPNQTSVTLSLTPTTLTHGQQVNYTIAVTPSAATGDVSLIGSPTGTGSDGMTLFTLQNGTASGMTTALAGSGGKAYQVTAHYAGDSNYAASDSKAVTVTVSAEPSQPVIWISTQSNPVVPSNPSSVTYGTVITGFVGVGNAQATANIPPQPVCVLLTCPTGSVTISESLNGASTTPVGSPAGAFPLDVAGFTQDFSFQPVAGQYVISASYPGDNSYAKGSESYALTVTPVNTFFSPYPNVSCPNGSAVLVGLTCTITGTITASINDGAVLTGAITLTEGTTPVPGKLTLTGQASVNGSWPFLTVSAPVTFATVGTHTVTATYAGDTNYAPSSAATTIAALIPTTESLSVNQSKVNAGQSVIVTATATSSYKSPPMTGTFRFYGGSPPFSPTPIGPVIPTLSTDANGNQVLTATATITPLGYSTQTISSDYSGDSNFVLGTATASFTVNPPDFAFSASQPGPTITAGQTGAVTLTITPMTNISSTVTLSCDTTAIAGATCSFNPSSTVNLNGTAATTTLMVTTLAPSTNPTTSLVTTWRPETDYVLPPGWRLLAVADGVAVLLLSLLSSQRRRGLATSLGMIGLLCLALSCGSGGGGDGGGGGGGGGGPAPTTLTLTTSAVKVPAGSTVTFSVTVHSTQSPTGIVTLGEPGLQYGPVALINGTATFQLTNLPVGTHAIGAAYSGDSNNQGSQTRGTLAVVVTGISQINVSGTTSTLTHTTPVSVTIQ